MTSLVNLIDYGILEEEDDDVFVLTSDWKIDYNGWTVYIVEQAEDGSAIIQREGKYEEPVNIETDWDTDHSDQFKFYHRVDPEF